jgi:hypothetical protein
VDVVETNLGWLDNCTQSRVGECLDPGGEGFVGCDGDGRAFFSLGENLEQQFCAKPVKPKGA